MPVVRASFVHHSYPTRVVARIGAVQELRREIEALGAGRPVVLSGRSMAKAPLFEEVKHLLSELRPGYATDIPRHSSLEVVERIIREAAEMDADCLVAIGGGSVCDTAKGVALGLAEGTPVERHATRFVASTGFVTPPLLRPKLPIIAIPTTASGAEMTPAFGIMDDHGRKLLFRDAQVASRVVLLDAAAGMTVSASILLASGMNGLAHCVEALYANQRSPISSILAARGVTLFAEAMSDVASAPGDEMARHKLLTAGHIGGVVLATAGSCLHHAICHVLGAMSGLPHGDLNSVILPHAIEFNASCSRMELAPLCVDSSEPASFVRALQQRIGVPVRLRDLGIEPELLEPAAQRVMHERGIANNPRPVASAADVHALLLRAW